MLTNLHFYLFSKYLKVNIAYRLACTKGCMSRHKATIAYTSTFVLKEFALCRSVDQKTTKNCGNFDEMK